MDETQLGNLPTPAENTLPVTVTEHETELEVDGQPVTLLSLDDVALLAKSLGNSEVKGKIAFLGELDAEILEKAASAASGHMAHLTRAILVQRATEFNGHESVIREYLSGYNKQRGKQRANEARAIFDAFAKEPAKVLEFQGGYAPLVDACREIRGKRGGGRAKGTRVITSKVMTGLSEKIPHMSGGQAAVVVQDAIRQVQQTSGDKWEIALVRQISGIAVRLSQSKQPIYQDVAKAIQGQCGRVDSAETKVEHVEHAPPMAEGDESLAA